MTTGGGTVRSGTARGAVGGCISREKTIRRGVINIGSWYYGKGEVTKWIMDTFQTDASILDVGACDGTWHRRLLDYSNMDAIEIFDGNIPYLTKYRNVFHADIIGFEYDWYDLIIFGDVIEHMTVENAQKVLNYAWPRCRDMIVAVPFELEQGECYGNHWEIHIQDDLTREIFDERYPGFEVLVDPGHGYMYYHKPKPTERSTEEYSIKIKW